MAAKEGDVFVRCAGGAKTCGGLDEIRIALSDALTEGDLFFFREIAGLDDDFQDSFLCGVLERGDFCRHLGEIAVFDVGQAYDGVDFLRAVCYRLPGGGNFCLRGIVTKGKADDGADWHGSAKGVVEPGNVSGGNTDGSGTITARLLAKRLDFLPSGRGAKQRMINMG